MLSLAADYVASAWDAFSPAEFSRLYRRVRKLTMCSNARLRGLHRAVRHVVAHSIPGDVVECGAARGGSAALMGLTLRQLGADERTLWVFDTFEGLPPPSAEDPDYEIAAPYTGSCAGSFEEVTQAFRRLGIAEHSRLVKGLYEHTLAAAPVERIAVLHIDADWYLSVRCCLDSLYDKVVPGGVIQFDDYGWWQGARKAVDEFFAARSLAPGLLRLDYAGRQFIKPAGG
jgi:O-methyltransferase